MIWLHGLGESSLCFAAISRQPALQHFRHRIVDLPGYGRSHWPAEPYRLDEAATELASWLVADAGEPAVLLGHSMGGVLAQLIAERAPAQVRAVINVDGNLSLADCTFSGKATAFPLAAFLAKGFEELQSSVYTDGITRPPLRGYYASMRFADPRVFHRHALDLLELSTPEDLARRLAALPMPSLYIAGSPEGASARSKELLVSAAARWKLIESSGHWPFLDQPEAFATAVGEFLSSLS